MFISLSQDTLDILIDIVLYSMLAFPPWLIILMVLTWMSPKGLTDRYFTSPHFSDGELAAYSNFPLTHLKTLIFIYALAAPKRYYKREMTEIREYVPSWYFRTAMIWLAGIILIGLGFAGLMIPLIVYIKFFHNGGV